MRSSWFISTIRGLLFLPAGSRAIRFAVDVFHHPTLDQVESLASPTEPVVSHRLVCTPAGNDAFDFP
jgi:hypothetical protein